MGSKNVGTTPYSSSKASDFSGFTGVNGEYPSEVVFQFRIFIREFVIMTSYSFCGPFSLPLLLYLCGGMDGIRMRLFWGKGSALQFISWALTAAAITMGYLSESKDVHGELLWLSIVTISRCAMIGCKYAYTSEEYLNLLFDYSLKNESLLRSQQVGTAWVIWEDKTVEKELKISMQRNNVKKDSLKLLTRIHEDPDSCSLDPPEFVYGGKLARMWLVEASQQIRMNHREGLTFALLVAFSGLFSNFVISVVNSATNGLVTGRDASTKYKSLTNLDIVALTLIAILVFMVEAGHFLFLGVCMKDAQRRLYMMKKCTILIAPSHSYLRQASNIRRYNGLNLPLLNHGANTIHAWVLLRRVCQDFGKDFMTRLAVYYSITVGMVLGIAATFFLKFAVVGFSYVDIVRPANAPLILLAIICIAFLMRLIQIGSTLNSENLIQIDVLLDYSREMENRLERATRSQTVSEAEIGECSTSLKALKNAREQLHVDYELRPFKVLGVPASAVMVKIVLSLLGSYVVVMMRLNSS